jgi:hypothetical protein
MSDGEVGMEKQVIEYIDIMMALGVTDDEDCWCHDRLKSSMSLVSRF